MATFRAKGLDEYIEQLERLSNDSETDLKRTIYAGATVVADAIKAALHTIPTHPPNQIGTVNDPIVGLTEREKADVIASFGLAPIKRDGHTINTKAGFDGYGSVQTKKYPAGVPNSVLIRSVESGTSFRRPTPVISQAVNKVKAAAIQAMQIELEKTINENQN